jgi:hypothetical protein
MAVDAVASLKNGRAVYRPMIHEARIKQATNQTIAVTFPLSTTSVDNSVENI